MLRIIILLYSLNTTHIICISKFFAKHIFFPNYNFTHNKFYTNSNISTICYFPPLQVLFDSSLRGVNNNLPLIKPTLK